MSQKRKSLQDEIKQTTCHDLVSLRIPDYLDEEIKKEAKRIGASKIDMTRILWEFYNFEHLDILVKRVKERYLQGFSSEEIAHLSVLYSLLSYINLRSKILE